MATIKQSLGTYTAMTVTNLQSLASSATVGWKSAAVDNTLVLALDYEVLVYLPTANTAPANDKAVYVYVYSGIYTGAAWYYSDKGNTTVNDGAEGASTIALPNAMRLARVLPYTTAQEIINSGGFYIAQCFGGAMPDAWGIQIINYTGAALSTGCIVAYRALTATSA
jgi:hypothetical protein